MRISYLGALLMCGTLLFIVPVAASAQSESQSAAPAKVTLNINSAFSWLRRYLALGVTLALNSLTEPTAVFQAIAEYDRVGAQSFLAKYGFRPAREYFLLHEGRLYDSKAIAGAAHGYQHPSLGHLSASDFSGGEATVAKTLRGLGFKISRQAPSAKASPPLVANRAYSWEELGELFDFKPAYLSAAGGMVGLTRFRGRVNYAA
ncbi:MAG: hypothetical protein ACKOEC_01670 [Acidimicrobiia bacterium]